METYLRTHYIAVPLFSMLQLQEVEEVRVPEANEPDKVRRLPFQFVRICECIGGNWEEEEGNMVGAMVELDGCLLQIDRKSTRLNSSHALTSRMPSSA